MGGGERTSHAWDLLSHLASVFPPSKLLSHLARVFPPRTCFPTPARGFPLRTCYLTLHVFSHLHLFSPPCTCFPSLYPAFQGIQLCLLAAIPQGVLLLPLPIVFFLLLLNNCELAVPIAPSVPALHLLPSLYLYLLATCRPVSLDTLLHQSVSPAAHDLHILPCM